ncbi:hypothetical protein BGX27_001578 [Mortierella sp. AM989]|nr:hypothetical protein BGX27_001578 [Mortierella sp. AM989]
MTPLVSLSAFDIPHILEQIFSYVDDKALQSCLRVSKSWYTIAATFRWHTCYVGWGKLCPPWEDLINNIHHIRDMTLALPLLHAERDRRLGLISAAMQETGRESSTSGTKIRLRVLTIVGQEGYRSLPLIFFPTIPHLRKLIVRFLRVSEATVPVVVLETIIGNFSQLQELELLDGIHLSIGGIDVNGKPMTSPAPRSPLVPILSSEPQISSPALNLTTLDFGDSPLTAQLAVDIAPWFPRVKTLKICTIALLDSLQNYHSSRNSSGINRTDSFIIKPTPGKYFARDFASAWPHLVNFSLNRDEKLRRLRSSNINFARESVTYARNTAFARDLVAALVRQLKVLSLPMVLVDEVLLSFISSAVNPITGNVTKEPQERFVEHTFLRLQQLSITGPDFLPASGHELASSQALLGILENCSTLRDLSAKFVPIGSALLWSTKGKSISGANDSEQLEPSNHLPSDLSNTSLGSSHTPFQHTFWACKHLEYLHLDGTYEKCTLALHNDDEGIELSRGLFKQLSMLTKLKFLRLDGFAISKDLERSGFHQLATLRELEALSVEVYFSKTFGYSDTKEGESDDDAIPNYLGRKDLEWMVIHWPRLLFLSLGGDNDILRERKLQRWINDAAGPGRVVALMSTYSFTSLSEAYRVK